jgi:hypothetical protein
MKTLKMKRLLVVGLAAAATATGASAQAASTLTVCPSGCAFTQVAAAVAAATDGDTISVAPGTYQGGFTIDVSVKLAGAGPGRTTISGGGPVLTIGTFGAASEPTVSIDGVTITGGVTRSSPESVPCTGKEGVWAAGGGIEVPPSTFSIDSNTGVCDSNSFGGGATVTIANSVITGNRVAPSDTVVALCGGCPVAWAFGGGIDTSGSLTLANTTVSDNRMGSASGLSELARFAEGGGIFSGRGDMTISNSTISGNQAAVSPHGVIADAGGIAFNTDTGANETGTFSMSNSSVTNNSATVNSDFGFGFVPSGGLHIKGGTESATISNSTISGNAATYTNSSGGAVVGDGGLKIDVCPPAPCALSNDTISDNIVTATALPGSDGDASGDAGAGEFGGTLSNVRITGNRVDVSSAAGNAHVLAGATLFDAGTISNSLISNNDIEVSAPAGSVDGRGGGLDLLGTTTLRNSIVSGNTVRASGTSGSARGGGIFDMAFPFGPGGPPLGGPLALQNSRVTGNTLSGTGLTLEGGGTFAQGEPVTLTHTAITQNVPDQCFGC